MSEKQTVRDRICVYCEQKFNVTRKEIKAHAAECKESPVVQARAAEHRRASKQRNFGQFAAELK